MRIQEFLIRILFFVPLYFWLVFLFMMVLGIIAYSLGANDLFYCTFYCKIAAALVFGGIIAIIVCQLNACWRK